MLKFIAIICVIMNTCLVGAEQLAPTDVLFHGSSNADINEFEPRSEKTRDVGEGRVVFATPSIRMASCFLFKWDDSWAFQFITSKDNDKSEYEITMVISDRERFDEADKGGVIYLLPAENFFYQKERGLGIYEWTSRKNVIPLAKLSFPSALKAMQSFGVRVYFVNKKQFKKFLSLPGEEWDDYLKNLTPALTPLKN